MERYGEVYFCGKFKYGIVIRDYAYNVRGRWVYKIIKASFEIGYFRGCK